VYCCVAGLYGGRKEHVQSLSGPYAHMSFDLLAAPINNLSSHHFLAFVPRLTGWRVPF
jgi:hypothetical protein